MAFPSNAECLALSDEDLKTLSNRALAILNESEELGALRRYKRAIQKALRAADLYEVAGNRLLRARCLSFAGLFCLEAKHYRAAAYYMWKGLRVLQKSDREEQAHFWGTLAKIYRILWAMNRADKYYRLYVNLSMKQDNMIQVGYGYLGLGLNYYQGGDYSRALDLTQRAMKIFGTLEQKELKFLAELNVACFHNRLGHHALSLEMLTEILSKDALPDNSLYICRAYHELAKTYLSLNDMEGYRAARDKAREYASLSKDIVELGRMTMLDAECYASQGQRRKAMQQLRKAIVVFRNHGSPTDLIPAERLLMSWLKGGDNK